MLGKIGTTLSQKTIVRTLLFRIGLVTGIAFILLGISFHLHPLGSLKAYLAPQAQTSATTIPTALVFVIVAILITYGILLRFIISKTLGNQLKAVTQGIWKFDVNETELITAKSDYAEINHLICSLNELARRFKDRHLEIHEYENRLSMSLKGGKSGIWNWNVKNGRVFFDDNYYLMAGYEPGDFPSDYNEWKIRVHPDHIANAEYKVQRCLNGEIEEFDVEFKFRRKDGSWMWILGIGRISESDQEGAIRFSGIHVDVTERKQAEQEAKHLRNYLSNILNSMPSVLIGIDTEGIVTQWNRHAELITGFKVEEAMGSLLVGVYPQLSSEMLLIQKAIRTHQVQQKKHQPRIYNGNQVYEDITIYPVISTKVDGVVIRVDDVTELVRYEEMIVQSEKMLSVGGLAAGMAHEINNPLAGMVQNAFLIKSRLMDIQKPANVRAADEVGISLGKLREFMESRNIPRMINNIDEAGKRMSEIINNMLSFSRKTDLSAECYHPG
ncbi:MAG: PAS domain S-box protein [Proteobacteria bacterium]|nr:PAS domain S-box protein [Pseudomonadota bacterium]